MRTKKKLSKKSSLCDSSNLAQLSFIPPNLNFSDSISETIKQEHSNKIPLERLAEMQDQTFDADDRQSLKNAFRYICRLIFKQAPRYKDKINEIAQKYQVKLKKSQNYNYLFEKAQQISGERYFRKYVGGFQKNQQKIICEYMKWFLISKYLRYVGQQGKGKRKQMKKSLYLKFKNQVMLPYIQGFI